MRITSAACQLFVAAAEQVPAAPVWPSASPFEVTSECRAGWMDDAMLVAAHNHTSAGTRLSAAIGFHEYC